MREASGLSALLRFGLAVIVASGLLAARPPSAQEPPPPPALPGLPAAAGKPAEPAAADVDALIATLENDRARAELLARLKALTAAAPAGGAAEQDYVGSLVDTVNDAVAERVDTVGQALVGIAASAQQVPLLLAWSWRQLTEPISRALWYSVASQIGGAVLAGFAASVVVRLVLRGWRDRRADLPLEARRKARLKASLAHLAVNLAALASFLAVTHLVLGYTAITLLGRRVAGDILIAIAWVRVATALSKCYLAPENPRRRLAGMGDAAAVEAQRWVAVLFGLSFYGHYGLEAARRLGLPWTVHGFLQHLLFLVVALVAIRGIYRLRNYLGAAIERWGASSGPGLSRYLPWRAFSSVGHHVLAAWVGLVYLVWAIGAPGGALLLTRGMLVTILALIAARAVNLWLDWRLMRRAEAEAGDAEDGQAPEAEPMPALHVAAITAARIAVALLALGAVAQAWGLDMVGWVNGETGRTVLATVARTGLILAVVVAAGQVVQRGSARYLAATDANGNPLYSNRTRTLISMARNLAVTMLVAVGVIQVLSELGVNANALLAGAGVVGLAIGFGAQTLVKDLITGLFILVGDTVRVGDVVDLGGKSGVVEAISMRTITLRAYNGDVHTIPYSSIDVVTNMTKDFSFYVFDLVVGFKEDVDRVVEVLREIDSQLRREWPYRRLMLEPLEIAGLDAFRDSGVLVKARTRVRAGEQWKVGREFNRRIKRRFDELGIEIAVPQQRIYFAPGREDEAPQPPAAAEPLRRAVGEA